MSLKWNHGQLSVPTTGELVMPTLTDQVHRFSSSWALYLHITKGKLSLADAFRPLYQGISITGRNTQVLHSDLLFAQPSTKVGYSIRNFNETNHVYSGRSRGQNCQSLWPLTHRHQNTLTLSFLCIGGGFATWLKFYEDIVPSLGEREHKWGN